ncbi:MAG: TorD/DmsD family molecular chaperone [Pseudomonadota bacterium]
MPSYDPQQGLARETFCRLLAACHYEPAPEFAQEKIFDSLQSAAAMVDPALAAHARRMGEEFAARGPDDLLVDYTRLFLGPSRVMAKPYGSAWLDTLALMMGDSTLSVTDLYREGGFEIDESFHELPDHIAAELEFLYLLIFRENRARRDGDAERLDAAADLKRRFLDRHLGAWVGPFAAAVKAGAETDFYRALAELTERFVRREADGGGPP